MASAEAEAFSSATWAATWGFNVPVIGFIMANTVRVQLPSLEIEIVIGAARGSSARLKQMSDLFSCCSSAKDPRKARDLEEYGPCPELLPEVDPFSGIPILILSLFCSVDDYY